MQELITKKFTELQENGKLDEIVTKQVTEFYTKTLQDLLSPYGDINKEVSKKLKEDILGNVKTMNFIQYSKTISLGIEEQLKNTILEVGLKPIKEMISEFTGELEKDTYKISEIIEKFKMDSIRQNNNDEECGEIYFFNKKTSYGFENIYFNFNKYISFDFENKIVTSSLAKYQLSFYRGELCLPNIKNNNLEVCNVASLSGFDLFLFKLYATKAKIILDTDSVDTEWSLGN